MSNIYKPRYKVCYQTNNKVWIYKNSRLRKIYNIRSKIILRKSWKYKKIMVTKNMKWTIVRRFMVPYSKMRINFLYNYKNTLQLKQQLKKFYGKLKEHQLRTLFKKSWNKEQYFKRNIFISSLEQRLDMVVYRMRILPTIFSSHQLIDHQGVLVNNQLVTIPGYKVKIGDIVSIKKNLWPIFYDVIYYKLKKRFFGQNLLIWRKRLLLNKVQSSLTSKKNQFRYNLYFIKEYSYNKKRFKVLNHFIYMQYLFFKSLKKEEKYTNDLINNKQILFYKLLNYILLNKINKELNIIKMNIKKLFNWTNKNYLNIFNIMIKKNYYISKMFLLLICLINEQNLNWKFEKNKQIIINNNLLNIESKNKTLLLLIFNKNKLKDNFYNNYEYKQKNLLKKFRRFLKKKYNKVFKLNYHISLSNRRPLFNKRSLRLIRNLKYQKKKKTHFSDRCLKHHWYTPNYLEVDYKTLRASFLYYPTNAEVFYGFPCSFDKIISFYKERAL